jgi:hypothetical protein
LTLSGQASVPTRQQASRNILAIRFKSVRIWIPFFPSLK